MFFSREEERREKELKGEFLCAYETSYSYYIRTRLWFDLSIRGIFEHRFLSNPDDDDDRYAAIYLVSNSSTIRQRERYE